MRWAEYIARMGERRHAYRVLAGNLSERDHLEDRGIEGGIILEMDLQEMGLGRAVD